MHNLSLTWIFIYIETADSTSCTPDQNKRNPLHIDIRLVSMHFGTTETKQQILLHGYQCVVNQQNSKSNKLIKMTRAFQPYLTFTGEPPGFQPNLPPGFQPNLPCLTLLLEFCFYKKLLNFNKINNPIFLKGGEPGTFFLEKCFRDYKWLITIHDFPTF